MHEETQNRFHCICCPSCLETFEIAGPCIEECPTEWDYDCEVCCRPMLVSFAAEDGLVRAEARGIND